MPYHHRINKLKSSSTTTGGNTFLFRIFFTTVATSFVVLASSNYWFFQHFADTLQNALRDTDDSISLIKNNNNNNKYPTVLRDPFKTILPIFPKHPAIELHKFFDNYTRDDVGGWIDINKLSFDDVTKLREIASQIMDNRKTECGLPQILIPEVTRNNNQQGHQGNNETKARRKPKLITVPESTYNLTYCMWSKDYVSEVALDNFRFEQGYWSWVAGAFNKLYEQHPYLKDIDDDTGASTCKTPGLLDIGVNVGDWLSPIRLMAPYVPIYGVEGVPSTAAIAAANFRTSVEYHLRKEGKITAPSKLLPFTLAPIGRVKSIHQNGGVCFSEPEDMGEEHKKDNIGGRHVSTTKILDCPASGAAGATTLDHALKLLASSCPSQNHENQQQTFGPNIYIAKLDIEGYEFKALSSVIHWLSHQTPCYIMMEFRNQHSYVAAMEILVDIGYDSVWRPLRGELPPAKPWWYKHRENAGELQIELPKLVKDMYKQLLIGFSDIDSCITRMGGKSKIE